MMWDEIHETPPCSCGDAACFGECPDCGVHAPYVHGMECRIEEQMAQMDEALSCKVYGDDFFAQESPCST